MRAVSLFEEMAGMGIKPDVVSCTALVNALASSGESAKAEALVHWMLSNGIRPNVSELSLGILGLGKNFDRTLDSFPPQTFPLGTNIHSLDSFPR